MLLADKPLIFKVDPVTTGSDALVVGAEEMPPGNTIPTHKHLYEDKVVFVHKGTVRVTLAGIEHDAGTGATVFIPHGNWIGVTNVSSEPAMILFFFSKPSFEQSFSALLCIFFVLSWVQLIGPKAVAIAGRHKNGHNRKIGARRVERKITRKVREYRGVLVSAAGFEPATHALKGHCSTT